MACGGAVGGAGAGSKLSLSLFRGQPRLRVREQHYRVSLGNKRVGYGRIETIQKEKEKRISMEKVLLCTP